MIHRSSHDYIAHETLRRIQSLAATAAPDSRYDALARRFSISRLMDRAAHMRPYDGTDAEYLQEVAHRAGRTYDPGAPIIGWDALATRADTVGAGNAGGFLVGTDTLSAADALRPTTVTVQLGATVIDAKANVSLPRQTGTATAYWLTPETAAAPESDTTLGQLNLTPHNIAAYGEASRQLLLQSNADSIITRDLLTIVGRGIDKAALYGTGTGGQPVGITGQGIGTFSGTAATVGTFTTAFVGLGDGLGQQGGVAANRTVAGLLRQRPETSGSTRTLWDGQLTQGTVLDYPARSTTAIPSGGCIIGSWEYFVLAVWGGGLELTVNPYGDQVNGLGNFQKGVVGFRVMCSIDAGAIYPGAFAYSTGVT